MSSIVYGALTRKRQEAQPNESTKAQAPGLGTYVDTLAALVPAEVLAAHAALLSATTRISHTRATVIAHRETLEIAFWILVGLSVVFYVVGFQKREWSAKAVLGALIPPLAFIVWTAAQRTTAFDAVWPNVSEATRETIVVLGALSLGLAASVLPFALNKAQAKGAAPAAADPATALKAAAEARDEQAAGEKARAEADDKAAAEAKAGAEARDAQASQDKAQGEAEHAAAAQAKWRAGEQAAQAGDGDAGQAARSAVAQAGAEEAAAKAKQESAAQAKAAAQQEDRQAAEAKAQASLQDRQAAAAKATAVTEAATATTIKAG